MTSDTTIDILMITCHRPHYTCVALPHLLETCDDTMRVWLWQNGDDPETLEIVRSYRDHSRVAAFFHSPHNVKLREPTNWMWANSDAPYVAKVDDDCLVPDGWAQTLRSAHQQSPQLGAITCWHHDPSDIDPQLAERKVKPLRGGHRVMLNCWINGSGYVMKRCCVEQHGFIAANESFTSYCLRLSAAGWIHGWYYPFLQQINLDDPRTAGSDLTDNDVFTQFTPLSAQACGSSNLEAYINQLRQSATYNQTASPSIKHYVGWRAAVRRAAHRLGIAA